jgi:hypothetical protein
MKHNTWKVLTFIPNPSVIGSSFKRQEALRGVPAGLGLWRVGGPAAETWQRSGTACRRASARARLLARNMLPTALRVCRINLPMRADEARQSGVPPRCSRLRIGSKSSAYTRSRPEPVDHQRTIRHAQPCHRARPLESRIAAHRRAESVAVNRYSAYCW